MEHLYTSLINDKKSLIGFEYAPHPNIKYLKFKNHSFPWSIVSKEFNLLFETIIANNLKRGFEACTGIGLSALAAGLAMKITEGKIITIDAYIEEKLENFIYPENMKKITYSDADGYKNINYLIQKFSLEKHLFAEVGWSPDDIPSIVEKHFSQELDYIFIDSGHTEEQLLKEINCLLPYSNSDTKWLFHDVIDSMWTDKIEQFCRKNLNKVMRVVLSNHDGCSNLGILENI